MRTKRLHPVRRILVYGGNKTLGPILFIFGKFNIYYVSGYGIFDEYDLAIHSRKRFTLRCVILYQNF